MIIPRTRLLAWAAIILLPFGTLAGMDTVARPFSVAALLAALVLAIADALLAPRGLRGLGAELAPVVRATQGRDTRLLVKVQNQEQRTRQIRLTIQTPSGIRSATEQTNVLLPAGSEWSEVEWPLRASARGKFVVRTLRMEAVSPLGLWASWKDFAVQAEIRVYPNLRGERRSLAALFLNRGAVGLHAQRMIGKGREFEKLRDYVPGDGYDEIHWKATAKRGHPVTKVFQVERTQEIYVLIDASRLSRRETPGLAEQLTPSGDVANDDRDDPKTPLDHPGVSTVDRFITAALALGLAAEHQGDLFGLLTFSDKIETFLRARNGTAHYHACRDALYTLQARDVSPDFDELSTFIRLRLRRRALLLILTSLDDPVVAESFVRNMDLLCRQHLVLVNMLQRPGAAPLFSAEAQSEHQLHEHLAGHMRWQQLREVEKVLRRRGIRFNLIPSERLAADLVSQYINVKQRQAI